MYGFKRLDLGRKRYRAGHIVRIMKRGEIDMIALPELALPLEGTATNAFKGIFEAGEYECLIAAANQYEYTRGSEVGRIISGAMGKVIKI